MKTLDTLRKTLGRIGATLDTHADNFVVCDAPSGYVWRANGNTSLTIQYRNNCQSWLSHAIRDELPNLRMGLVKVANPARIEEIRYSLDDDSWGAPPSAPDRIAWPE